MRDVPGVTLLSAPPRPAEIVAGEPDEVGVHWTMPLGTNDETMLLS
jgi:hypothetical protein